MSLQIIHMLSTWRLKPKKSEWNHSEYIQFANIHPQMPGDSSNCAEPLEEAENACFTAMERAEIGNAYATLLHDQETSIFLDKRRS